MLYCEVIGDEKTIGSIKEAIDGGETLFDSFQEPEFGKKSISWMATVPLLDNMKALIEKYPSSEMDISCREEECDGIAYSIYAPGDGTALIVEFGYDDFVDEDEFEDEPVDGYDDWYDYYDEYFNNVNENPENVAKTSSRAEKFV